MTVVIAGAGPVGLVAANVLADAGVPVTVFEMEPRLPEFQRIRRLWDPEGRLKSAQSVRLLGDTP